MLVAKEEIFDFLCYFMCRELILDKAEIQKTNPIFPVFDLICCININFYDKKEFNEINDNKRIYF